MSIPTEVIMRMATLGLSSEQAEVVADMLTAVEAATVKTVAASYDDRIEASREKARARWHKWDSKQRPNVGQRLQTVANVSGPLTSGDVRVEDITSNLEIEPLKEESKKVARGTRLPSDFVLPDEWFRWAFNRGLPAPRIAIEFEKLTNWAANAPASKAVKRDWFKAWQTWVIGAIDALPKNRAPPASQAVPSMAQIFSVVRDHPHEIEPRSPEDSSGFPAAIQDLRPARTG